MAVSDATYSMSAGWLRGRSFDLAFIGGITLLALGGGLAVSQDSRLFMPLLLVNLWLLGFPHVITTFTRLCFDRESFRQNRFLVLVLPWLVMVSVVVMIVTTGVWALGTLYFYWQWFHYTRQSWGIARAYQRKSQAAEAIGGRWEEAAFYALPLWGILWRSYQDPTVFIGIELRALPVPEWTVALSGAVATVLFAWWLFSRLVLWHRGVLPLAHTLYMLSHFVIFFVGYIVIDDISHGWLVVNIWHNAQYLLFVWLFNNNRFRAGIDPKARFLSRLSQARNVHWYFLFCLALSTVVYLSIKQVVALSAIIPIVAIYQTLNFHHYIVDAIVWRRRRRPATA